MNPRGAGPSPLEEAQARDLLERHLCGATPASLAGRRLLAFGISIQCEGDCGEYNMSFSHLSDHPKFKED